MLYISSLLLLLSLALVRSAPTIDVNFESVFNDPTIPFIDSNALASLFNVTAPATTKSHPRDAADAAAEESDIEKRAFTLDWVLLNVVLDGRNLGNPVAFQKQGQIILFSGVPTSDSINSRNPTDVVIVSGQPIAKPVAGTLNYVTNRYLDKFIGGNQIDLFNTAYDFAYVTRTPSSVGVVIDQRAAQLNAHAYYNLNTGPFGALFKVLGGSFRVNLLANNKVSGAVSITGYTSLVGGRIPYKALIRGVVAGKGRGPF